jgi:hypothetical protein
MAGSSPAMAKGAHAAFCFLTVYRAMRQKQPVGQITKELSSPASKNIPLPH